MSDVEMVWGVRKPVEGEYGVIAEKNSITGKLQWSVGVWMWEQERVCSLCLVPHHEEMEGDETRFVEGGELILVSFNSSRDSNGFLVKNAKYSTDLVRTRDVYSERLKAKYVASALMERKREVKEIERIASAWEVIDGS